jgi:hypothetical protein
MRRSGRSQVTTLRAPGNLNQLGSDVDRRGRSENVPEASKETALHLAELRLDSHMSVVDLGVIEIV